MSMMKELPKGQFIFFNDLLRETTDVEIQELIAARTGVEIPLDRITIKTFDYYALAIVSFEKQHLCDILSWAFSEDQIGGQRIVAKGERDLSLGR
jgi:hypothetical protein